VGFLRYDLANNGEAWDGRQQLCRDGDGHGVGSVGVAWRGS
jgi:hypothetical protein